MKGWNSNASSWSSHSMFLIFFSVLLVAYAVGLFCFLLGSNSNIHSFALQAGPDDLHVQSNFHDPTNKFNFAKDLTRHELMHAPLNPHHHLNSPRDFDNHNNAPYQPAHSNSERHSSSRHSLNADPAPKHFLNSSFNYHHPIHAQLLHSDHSSMQFVSGASVVEPSVINEPWNLNFLMNGIQSSHAVFASNEPLLRVLVWHAHLSQQTAKAKQGNSMGELVYWRNVLLALQQIHCTLIFLTSENDLRSMLGADKGASNWNKNKFDVVLTDGYSLQPFEDWGLVKESSFRCRLRILDDWGTPARQNHHSLHLQQYLIPFKCIKENENFELGHFILSHSNNDTSASSSSSFFSSSSGVRLFRKKHQALLWGKEAGYFSKVAPLLKSLSEVIPLIAMAKDDATSHLPSSNARNLGILPQTQRDQLYAKSKLLIGLGDPVLGITPFEALRSGMVYFNPMYRVKKTYWMNSECALTSQHPYAEPVGPPRVHNVYLDDPPTLIEKVKEALEWMDQQVKEKGGVESYVPPEFLFVNFVRRLDANLRLDLCKA